MTFLHVWVLLYFILIRMHNYLCPKKLKPHHLLHLWCTTGELAARGRGCFFIPTPRKTSPSSHAPDTRREWAWLAAPHPLCLRSNVVHKLACPSWAAQLSFEYTTDKRWVNIWPLALTCVRLTFAKIIKLFWDKNAVFLNYLFFLRFTFWGLWYSYKIRLVIKFRMRWKEKMCRYVSSISTAASIWYLLYTTAEDTKLPSKWL